MIKLYNHGGSLNHGCEAILRSTGKIIDEDIELWSMNPELDKCYNIESLFNIMHDEPGKANKFISAKNIFISKILKSDEPFIKQEKKVFIDNITNKDICLSIGGDLYCYAGTDRLFYLNKAIKKKKAKIVLWGCSVEPDVIDKDNIAKKDLSQFDLITARESISYNALKKLTVIRFYALIRRFSLMQLSLIRLSMIFLKTRPESTSAP